MAKLTYPWIPEDQDAPPAKKYYQSIAGKDGIYFVRDHGKHSLHTLRWCDGVTEEVVATDAIPEPAEDFFNVNGLCRRGDDLIAVGVNGSIWQLGDGRWLEVSGPSPVLKTKPWDALIAWDEARGRVVQWGGLSGGGRAYSGLFFFDWGTATWRRSKEGSTRPRDTGLDHSEHCLFFDPHLGQVVRFGYHHVEVLDDDAWHPVRPPDDNGFTAPDGLRDKVATSRRIPVVDAASKEVIIVSLIARTLVRFDLARCSWLGDLDDANGKLGAAAHTTCVDAKHQVHITHQKIGHRTLDLRPLFRAASEFGPRETLPMP